MTEENYDWITQLEEQPESKDDRPSFKPGVYEGLSNDEYHRSQGISSTGLKRILRSPAHYKRPPEFNSTRAKEIGSAIHCAILEPERFIIDYRIVDCEARTSSAYKAACKDHPKERVLTTAEHENIIGMQAGVVRNRKCRELIEADGKYELSVFAKDPETGVLVKVRYDKLIDAIGMPVDVKKCQDASREQFRRSIGNYHYQLSAAFYMDAWEWLHGEKLDVMRWIAVEEQSPHAAARYMPNDEALKVGRAQYRVALNIYAECLERDEWPEYDPDDEEEIDLPAWMLDKSDEVEIDFGGDNE